MWLWETETGRQIWRRQADPQAITTIAFSPDERWVLTKGSQDPAKLWDLTTGRLLQVFHACTGALAAELSRDGKLVLVYSSHHKSFAACLFRAASAGSALPFSGLPERFPGNSVARVSPDGRYLMTTSGKTARLWSTLDGDELWSTDDHEIAVTMLAFSPDSSYAMTGGIYNESARLWDVKTGRQLRRFLGRSFVFDPKGGHLLTMSDDASRLWNIETGQEVWRVKARQTSAGFTPDATRVLTISGDWSMEQDHDNLARLRDVRNGRLLQRFGGHTKQISSVVFSPDGHLLFCGVDDGTGILWDLLAGGEVQRFQGHSKAVHSAAFASDGTQVITASLDHTTARVWDIATGRSLSRIEHGSNALLYSVRVSPDGRYVLTSGGQVSGESVLSAKPRLWDIGSGRELWRLDAKRCRSYDEGNYAFSLGGRYLARGGSVVSRDNKICVWEVETGKEIAAFDGNASSINAIAVAPDGEYLVTGNGDKTVRLFKIRTGREIKRFEGHNGFITAVAFSARGNQVVSASDDWTLQIHDVVSGGIVKTFAGHVGGVRSFAVSPDGKHLASAGADQSVRIWNIASGEALATLVSLDDGTWTVVTADGRFDTNNLDNPLDLHWIMPDEPLTALPIEIFMRDYYEPRLLSRRLAGEELRPIRQLANLNRVQPEVRINSVELDACRPEPCVSDRVSVVVEVGRNERKIDSAGKVRTWATGVYDLRLFRDGQLVAQFPDLGEDALSQDTSTDQGLHRWRRSHGIELDRGKGKTEVTFRGIGLPRRKGVGQVVLSAYAFNEDRVKSATARRRFALPKQWTPRLGRAYLVMVGVNAFENPHWDLRYAAADARRLGAVLQDRLRMAVDPATGKRLYQEIVSVSLISEADPRSDSHRLREHNATKDKIRAVLERLGGKAVAPERLVGITGSEYLAPARPEDLVLIALSTHGVTDAEGRFYLLPHDIGQGAKHSLDPSDLKRTISSDELSAWLRPLDARDLVMIVDACHSAASVEGENFKPGPMGSRGLGQLAYDKGMRILAASQVDQYAIETEAIGQGLLSYALVHDGLERGAADFRPRDRRILLSEWLAYGKARVPELYREWQRGELVLSGKAAVLRPSNSARDPVSALQQPALFDFASGQDLVLDSGRPSDP